MKKTIKEDKKTGTVTLKIELSKRSSANDTVINFLTRDARKILQSEGYNITSCRKNDSASNHKEDDSHVGEWVFAVERDVVNPSSKKNSDSKKESLTSEVEPAIIDNKKGNSTHHHRKGK